MRARLATCSVLRSCGVHQVRLLPPALRACRDGPSSREGPPPTLESDSLRSSLQGFLPPPPPRHRGADVEPFATAPRHIASLVPPDATAQIKDAALPSNHRWGWEGLRILLATSEASRQPSNRGGGGGSREGGPSRRAHRAGGRKRTSCTLFEQDAGSETALLP